ncbi:unnamed protein product [Parascedosporium putredinis]|uniref:Uncharacterized protein n=1 Tax=Parascedosporium putredinis TaxID=1442378 RepID=A0A9P1H046_9PEZI|nr:unnamed protein product [Parascedosporium putredinis]CAI7993554.1 unnamed protein product [Parascedosporium putredinis]
MALVFFPDELLILTFPRHPKATGVAPDALMVVIGYRRIWNVLVRRVRADHPGAQRIGRGAIEEVKPGPEPEPEPEAEPSATTDPPSGAAGCDDSSDGSASGNDDSDSPPLPRRARWAKVSGSGNLDDWYRKKYRNPQRARKFICLCKPSGEDDDDDWEDEDESDEGEESGDDDIPVVEVAPRRRCDGGKTCLCYKPAKKHPEHSWIMTKAGNELAGQSIIHLQLRSPDNFDSYTFNDHEAFGALEIIQNLLRDFEEAAGEPWVRQWAICEALAQILVSYDHFQPLFMIDHTILGDMADMIGRMFLTQLATLENEGLLGPNSEVMNLALVMGLYLQMASMLTAMGVLDSDDDEDEDEEPSGKEKTTAKGKKAAKASAFKYSESCWDLYIYMYAQKHSIVLNTLTSSHTKTLLTRLSEKPSPSQNPEQTPTDGNPRWFTM